MVSDIRFLGGFRECGGALFMVFLRFFREISLEISRILIYGGRTELSEGGRREVGRERRKEEFISFFLVVCLFYNFRFFW